MSSSITFNGEITGTIIVTNGSVQVKQNGSVVEVTTPDPKLPRGDETKSSNSVVVITTGGGKIVLN